MGPSELTLVLLTSGSVAAAVSYVISTLAVRSVPKDEHVDELLTAVQNMAKQARSARMTEVRAQRRAGPPTDQPVTPDLPGDRKSALRARLRGVQ